MKASSLAFNSSPALVLLVLIYSSTPHLSTSALLPNSGPFFSTQHSIYSSLSCSWTFNWLSLSCISCLMDFSISSTAALLPRGYELSACSWWTCLTSGEKVSTGLTLLCLFEALELHYQDVAVVSLLVLLQPPSLLVHHQRYRALRSALGVE